MHDVLLFLAQGRGDDSDGAGGVMIIIGVIALMALTMAAVATVVIRRSRRGQERTGPEDEPHEPGHGGRVSGMEPDGTRR